MESYIGELFARFSRHDMFMSIISSCVREILFMMLLFPYILKRLLCDVFTPNSPNKPPGQTRGLPLYTHIFVIYLYLHTFLFHFFFIITADMVPLVARRLVCVLTPIGSCVLMHSAPILVINSFCQMQLRGFYIY
jgi:hypothetical protein